MDKRVSVIGSGFAGISAACYLAKYGFEVIVYEKNSTPGGRAGQIRENGFIFDTGPSWYWMPDLFENFFKDFDKDITKYYTIKKLDPSYRIFYCDGNIDIHADKNYLDELFEDLEKGSSTKLRKFLKASEEKYKIGVLNAAFKPGHTFLEYLDKEILIGFTKLKVIRPISKVIRKLFSNNKIIRLLEFPVLFLGSTPQRIPALYSLMNYADLVQGTWYPSGGFYSVIEGFYRLALELNVKFEFNADVEQINVINNKAASLVVNGREVETCYVVSAADYYHVEQNLLEKKYRNYSNAYWEKKEMAPSALVYFIGLNTRVEKLLHHNIFFDEDFDFHAKEIYDNPRWPANPCIYISCNSKTDTKVAPDGCDALAVLIPVAPNLNDNEEIKDKYYHYVIDKIEKVSDQKISDNVVYKNVFSHSDYKKLFYAYKGNAYGLANTLFQTGPFKPSIRNKKVKNLFYCGQLTVPGPGVPPSIISGKVVADEVKKNVKS